MRMVGLVWSALPLRFVSIIQFLMLSSRHLRIARRVRPRCSSFALSTLHAHANNTSSHSDPDFLGQVECSVESILAEYYGRSSSRSSNHQHIATNKEERDAIILKLPTAEREPLGVAHFLHARLAAFKTNKNCRRCWLNPGQCVCGQLHSLEDALPSCIHRIFVLAHHREVGLLVDTAKLILTSFPESSRLIVAGIPERFQPAIREFEEAVRSDRTMVLFPDEGCAKTFGEWNPSTPPVADHHQQSTTIGQQQPNRVRDNEKFDLVVIDGTWGQARRMYQRYIPDQPRRVNLSSTSLASLESPRSTGQQLRRHPVSIRQIATAHALQLLLQDVASVSIKDAAARQSTLQDLARLGDFQQISNHAAQTQLPPVRARKTMPKEAM